jgi:hypothetical protein
MIELGWRRATETPAQNASRERDADGSPNFFVDTGPRVDFVSLTRLAVRSLRDVYRVGHRGELQYSAFGKGEQIRFPTLQIKRRKP